MKRAIIIGALLLFFIATAAGESKVARINRLFNECRSNLDQLQITTNTLEEDKAALEDELFAAQEEIRDLLSEREELLTTIEELEGSEEPVDPPSPPGSIPAHAYDFEEKWPPPAMDLPAAGEWVSDPVFGTPMMRLPKNVRHVYSQLQPWSADGTRMIVYLTDKHEYGILNMETLQIVVEGGLMSPRWNGNTLLDLHHDGRIQVSGALTRVNDLYEVHIRESYEMPNEHGMLAVYYADRIGLVDVELSTLLYSWPVSALASSGIVNWVRAAPGLLGGFVVQYSDGGTHWYDDQGTYLAEVSPNHMHSDLRFDGSAFEYAYHTWDGSGRQRQIVVYSAIFNSAETVFRYATNEPWSGSHISMTGDKGIVMSTMHGEGALPLGGEIVQISKDGTHRRLAHHRSIESDYWSQPHAAASPSGRYVVFATDWHGTGSYSFVLDTGAE